MYVVYFNMISLFTFPNDCRFPAFDVAFVVDSAEGGSPMGTVPPSFFCASLILLLLLIMLTFSTLLLFPPPLLRRSLLLFLLVLSSLVEFRLENFMN